VSHPLSRLFRWLTRNGILLFPGFLFFCGTAVADPSDIFELSGGEMIFSQRAQFYDVEAGGLIPLPVFSSGTVPAYFHFFVAGSFIGFDQPATGGTPGINGITDQSYTGAIPAIGLRIPASWGFWEGDVGGAFFNIDQTLTPVTSIADIYLQTELFINEAGPGSLDLFGSYIGGINYLYGMGRYQMEAAHTPERGATFYAGPEVIAQGNDTYAALQAGGVLSADVPSIHTIFTLEAGLLNSTVWPGLGGYEGFSFYYSY
jgi:hypothetical protein